jgi:hypothetical protein
VAKINDMGFASLPIYHILRWSTNGSDDAAIDSGQSDRVDSALPQGGKYFGIDLAAEHHLRKIEGLVIGNPAALYHGLIDAQLVRKLAELFSAPVYHTDAYSDLMQQG